MKVNILYPIKEGPFGGANQFLKGLRKELIALDIYENEPLDTDVILFNSSPQSFKALFPTICELKKRKPELILINRIDGPVYFIRNKDVEFDHAFFYFSKHFADGTIYQSDWSRNKCMSLGMEKPQYSTTIINAPDASLFYPKRTPTFNNKAIIIATSWSANWSKGFGVYKWLDENLDFEKYEFRFVGNSPVDFVNIKHLPPMKSEELAEELREADIYITASQNDPCSNSLIEAIHCGCIPIVLDDGGHTEIVNGIGHVFNANNEILEILENLNDNKPRESLATMEKTAFFYVNFFNKLYDLRSKKSLPEKSISFMKEKKMKAFFWKNSIKSILKLN